MKFHLDNMYDDSSDTRIFCILPTLMICRKKSISAISLNIVWLFFDFYLEVEDTYRPTLNRKKVMYILAFLMFFFTGCFILFIEFMFPDLSTVRKLFKSLGAIPFLLLGSIFLTFAIEDI